ncbi:phage tail assembly chaperone [Megamonas funiformis]|uniref:phage tail assembly chaperone n=1 Tax=Megamonas funiformis TaxID=437897 RepID=UPI00195709E8|nr:hypothetical protein [Megamonas funiformis]MBM6727521.1 hypothetical protein [Megamonas funiformis]
MNLVDILLNADTNAVLAEKTEEYEVERLSKILGEKFVLILKAIPAKRYSEIQTTAINMNGKRKSVDLYKMQMLTLNEGIKEPNLAEPNLLKKFGATTPFDMYEKLFLAGEITNITNKISTLSGYSEEEKQQNIEEIKN